MPDPISTTTRAHGLSRYLVVLRRPGVGRPAVGAAVASLPIGMLGLAVLLLVAQSGSGFTGAGLVVGALGVGTGIGMVVQGRLIDRFGPPRVLLPFAAVQAAAVVALVGAVRSGAPTGAVIACAVVAGGCEPQVGSSLRALWADLVPAADRSAATAVSSLLFEGPVLLGPLLLAGLLRVGDPAVAVLAAAACFAVGTGVLARSPAARRWRPPARRLRSVAGALSSPVVRTIALITAVQGLVTGLVQVTATAAATAHATPGRAPLLYAALSVGSLLGTLAYGTRHRTGPPAHQLGGLLAVAAAAAVGCAVAPGLGWLACGLFTVGLAVGPVAVCCFTAVDVLAPAGAVVEAFTTVTATGLGGFAAGTAAAGLLVTDAAPGAGFLAAAAIAGLTVVAVVFRRRTLSA